MLAPAPTFAQQPTKATNKDNDLKNQFMTLLTEQVKNQDPTDPLKPREQIAQLAQLSSLEQSQAQTETLKNILKSLPNQNSPAVSPISLVGHKIEFNLNKFMIQNDAKVKYKLDQGTIVGDSDITITITDDNGRKLQSMTVTKDDFDDSLIWDGTDKNGMYVGYKPINITATQETKSGTSEVKLIGTSEVKSFNFHTPSLMKLENDVTIDANDIKNVF